MRCSIIWLTLLALGAAGASAAETRALELAPGNGTWDALFATPSATMDGPVVVLSGVVRLSRVGQGLTHIATAPPGMRPAQAIVLRQGQGNATVRIDVRRDGRILADGAVGEVVSLAGIAYPTRLAEELRLTAGFSNFGDPFGSPRAYKHDDLVMLSGMVRTTGGPRAMTTLPPQLRPAERLIFAVPSEGGTTRVDVAPDGTLSWTNGAGGWISLSGINFPARVGSMLPMGPGYIQYRQNQGGDFGEARALQIGPFTVLSGLVIGMRPGQVLSLPPAMRLPTWRMLTGFGGAGAAAQNATIRLDLAPDGRVIHRGGGPAGGWLTLSGLVVANAAPIPPPAIERVSLRTHHQAYVVAEADGRAEADRAAVGGWETWTLTRNADATVSLRSHHGTYLTAEGDGGAQASQRQITAAARWRLRANGDGTIALQSHQNKYLVAESGGALNANRGAVGGYERFIMQPSTWQPPTGSGSADGPRADAPSADAPNAGGPSPDTNDAALAQQILTELKRLDWSLSPKLLPQLNGIRANAMTRKGTAFEAQLTIANQAVTVVIYRPAQGKPLEVAFVTNDLSTGNLIGALQGTEIDDFRVSNAAFIFVARDNERTATLASLPPSVRATLGDLTWSAFELVAGQNVLGRLHARFSGVFADIVRETGICGGGGSGCDARIDVLANYGRRAAQGCRTPAKRNTKGWRVRMTRPGVWRSFFGINGVDMTNATMEIAKEDAQKLVRAWSDQVTVDGKSYFLFGQCVTRACKAQNAFAISARALSLADYRTLMTKLASRVMGANVGEWQGGLDRLPLDAVQVQHRDGYTPAQNVDPATHDPRFGTMLGYFVGPNQTVPTGDASCLAGARLSVDGKGGIFGREVGALTASWREASRGHNARIEAEGTLQVPVWSPPLIGDLAFALRRETGDHMMSLSGDFGIDGVGTRSVLLHVDKQRMAWSNTAACPNPFKVTAAAGLSLTAGPPRFDVTLDLDAACLADALRAVLDTARVGVGVSEAYMRQGLLALGELGVDGIEVIGESVREGWETFNDNLEDVAGDAGKSLSEGTKKTLGIGKSAGERVLDWLP